MADRHILIGMGGTPESGGYIESTTKNLISYDPVSNTFSPIDPTTTGISGVPSRSLDGKYLLVQSGHQLFVYSTVGQAYLGSSTMLTGGALFPTRLAANLDGSQFVTIEDGVKVTFWNSSLQVIARSRARRRSRALSRVVMRGISICRQGRI